MNVKKTDKKRVFVTYTNGDKRKIIRDASKLMNLKLEQSEIYRSGEVPDFPVYHYSQVNE